jgi:hypothetical protein
MTVVRLPDGGLLLHSPIPFDDALDAALAPLGPVKHLVAPNKVHHLFVRSWLDRHPAATLHGAAGLPEKRRDLPFSGTLDDQALPAWQGSIDQTVIRGAPWLNEVVFFHRPSRTLILTDLLFNVRSPANLPTALVLRMMGTHKRLARSRVWLLISRDRAALRASVERILAWDFDRVSVAHGDPLGPGARPAVAAALAPFRE